MIRYSSCRTVRNKSKNYRALRTDFNDRVGTLAEIRDEIKRGFAICGAQLGNRNRKKAHVIGSQWVLIDIDSDWDISSALADPFVQSHCGLIYTTPSHRPQKHRFRLIFILPRFIEQTQAIEAVIKAVMGEIPQADPACKDACRIFFGNTEAEFPLFNPQARLSEAFVEDAVAKAEAEAKAKAEAKANQRVRPRQYFSADGVETHIAEILDALSYIPGRRPGTGTYEESLAVLMALKSELGESEAIAIAEKWSPSEGDWDVAKKIRSFEREDIKIGSLFYIAKQYGWARNKTQFKKLDKRIYKAKKPEVKCAISRQQTVIVFSHTLAKKYASDGYRTVCFPHPYDLVNGKKPNRELVPELKEKIEPESQWIIDPGLGEEHDSYESYRFNAIAAGIIGGLMVEAGGDVLAPHPQDRTQLMPIEDFKVFAREWVGGQEYTDLSRDVEAIHTIHSRYWGEKKDEVLEVINQDRGRLYLLQGYTGTGKSSLVNAISGDFHRAINFSPLVALAKKNAIDQGIERGDEDLLSGASMPINSIWKFAECDIPFDQPILLNFDEISECVKVLASGKMLGDIHEACLFGLARLINAVFASGGMIIGAQQRIDPHVVEWLTQFTPTSLIRNTYIPQQADVKIVEFNPRQVTGVLEHIVKSSDHDPGPSALASTSQKQIERLREYAPAKTVSVDSKTKELHPQVYGPESQSYLNRIALEQKDFAYSSTIGIGMSLQLKAAGFTRLRVIANYGSLEPVIQLARRDRSRDLPTEIYAAKRSTMGKAPQYSWKSILNQKRRKFDGTAEAVNFRQYLEEHPSVIDEDKRNNLLDGLDSAFVEGISSANAVFAAKQEAIESWEENHLSQLVHEWYKPVCPNVTFESREFSLSPEFEDEIEAIDDEILIKETNIHVNVDLNQFASANEARAAQASGKSTHRQRVAAKMYLASKKFPEADLKDPTLVRKAFVEDRGRYSKQAQILHDALNIDSTLEADRAALLKGAKSNFLSINCTSHRYKKAKLLKQSGLLELAASERWTSDDRTVVKVTQFVLDNANDFELFLNVRITDVEKTPLRLIHQLLGRLGFEVDCVGRQGAGERLREYVVVNKDCAVREELLKALDRARPRDLVQDSRVFNFHGRPTDLFDSGVKKVKLLANRITQVLVKCLETGSEFWVSREKLSLAI